MQNVFNPQQRYKCCLYGHCFDKQPVYVEKPGHFEADTIEQYDPLTKEREFAVFVVDLPQQGEYPVHHAGRYLIPMGALKLCPPQAI